MAATDLIEREYDIDDIAMLEKAQVFHDNFVIDKVAFTTAFTTLIDPFVTDFQTDIDDADAIPSGAEEDSEITVVTEQINLKMILARNALQKLFTYADVTWDSTAKTNTFGKGRYQKARESHLRMKELLETAHRKASDATNQTDLIASGYTLADVTELQTLMNDLDSMNANQEDLKSDRIVKTEARIIAYNKVWGSMRQINQASKVVFATDPAKLTQYLLYQTSGSSLPKPQNLLGTVDGADPNLADLVWDAVAGATGYEVQFSEVAIGAPSGAFGIIGTPATNSFQAPIVSNKRNYYKVRGMSSTQQSAWSDEVFLDGPVA